MNVISRMTAVLALILSILAIIMTVQAWYGSSQRIEDEVERHIAEREQAMVARAKDTINQMLADVGKPRRDIKTLEDAVDGIISVFNISED